MTATLMSPRHLAAVCLAALLFAPVAEAKPKAKRPQMFSAQTPVQIQGELSDFNVGLPEGALVGTTIRIITSPVITPFKWLLAKKAAADGKVACEQAWARQPPPSPPR